MRVFTTIDLINRAILAGAI